MKEDAVERGTTSLCGAAPCSIWEPPTTGGRRRHVTRPKTPGKKICIQIYVLKEQGSILQWTCRHFKILKVVLYTVHLGHSSKVGMHRNFGHRNISAENGLFGILPKMGQAWCHPLWGCLSDVARHSPHLSIPPPFPCSSQPISVSRSLTIQSAVTMSCLL